MIVDTTFLIDILRRDRVAIARLRALENQGETLWVPTPAIYELWDGVERGDRPDEEAKKIDALLRNYTVIAFDAAAAAAAGRLAGELARRGTVLKNIDVMIGGIALETGNPVLTRNAKDFEKIPGIEIVAY